MKCARYEVEFDSTVTSEGGFTGSTQSQSHNGSLRVVAGELLIDFATIASGTLPSAPLTYQGASWTNTITYAPSCNCTLVTTTTLLSTTPGTLRASIEFDINPFEPPPGEEDVPRKHVLRLSASGTGEIVPARRTPGCSSSFSDSTDTQVADDLRQLPRQLAVADRRARRGRPGRRGHRDASRSSDEQHQSGDTTATEETYVELWHKPQPQPEGGR